MRRFFRRRSAPAHEPRTEAGNEALRLNQVLWLVGALAVVAHEHVSRLPLWITGLAGLLAGARIYLAAAGLRLPPRWLLLPLVIASAGGVFLSYGTLIGRDSGVALLIVMLGFKLLEMGSRRDAVVVVLLACFVIITAFLYSQTIPTAVLMLCGVVLILTALIEVQRGRGTGNARESLRLGAMLVSQAAPLMLLLFLLFPRVNGPLWGLPQDAYSGLTGLSDTMTPGSLSRLGLSDAVAFRVAFGKTVPEPKDLYWRGPVLWYFDGASWHQGLSIENAAPAYNASGDAVRYAVTLEPHNKRWLFALDLPAEVPRDSRVASDFQLLANRPVRNRVRYEAASHLAYRTAPDGLNPVERRRALQLPEGTNWRTRALAENLRSAARNDREIMRNVLSMFRNQNFSYTLSPPLLGAEPVDEFLFSTRAGFCEHYASAFVFLMRAAGVPARVVTGYQGGEVNPVGNYLIVRQSEAHAWSEVWLAGEGWVRVDPTAAVSPLRVESGIAAAVPAGDPLQLLSRADSAWLRQLRFTWDSMANSWNQWVLGYTPERQLQFLSRVGLGETTWVQLAIVLVATTGLTTLVLGVAILVRVRRSRPDPAVAAWQRFCRTLARAGTTRRPGEGPRDFAQRAAREKPQSADAIGRISALYIDLRFGRAPPPEGYRELQRMVAAFTPR
jgi:transglutaminase-like putative cysteine protease